MFKLTKDKKKIHLQLLTFAAMSCNGLCCDKQHQGQIFTACRNSLYFGSMKSVCITKQTQRQIQSNSDYRLSGESGPQHQTATASINPNEHWTLLNRRSSAQNISLPSYVNLKLLFFLRDFKDKQIINIVS